MNKAQQSALELPPYQQAVHDLQRMFGPQAPHQLVACGKCSLNDWLRVLNARREAFEVTFGNQAQVAMQGRVSSVAKSMILAAIASGHDLQKLKLKAATVERELLRMGDEGMLEERDRVLYLTRRGQRALNAYTAMFQDAPARECNFQTQMKSASLRN